jgi:DNA-binding MarR family transcriptional regulator
MAEKNFAELDDIIHSKIRLGVMSVLMTADSAQFTYLKEVLKTTDGNLSVHLRKLEDAGYIRVEKKFVRRKPQTLCRITSKGRKAFERYVEVLERIIGKQSF